MDAAGFVLAGGRSSRMGRDKALVEFGGQTLVEQAIGTLRAAGLSVSIAGTRPEARPRLESYAPVVPDAEPGLGPLGGICTALKFASAHYAVFASVDLPLLPPSLIVYLLHHARVAGTPVMVPSVSAFPQTFPVVLARDALPVIEQEVKAGRLGCYAAFEAAATALGQSVSVLPVEVLAQSGQISHPDVLPPVYWFLNINAPADLVRAASVRIRAAPLRIGAASLWIRASSLRAGRVS